MSEILKMHGKYVSGQVKWPAEEIRPRNFQASRGQTCSQTPANHLPHAAGQFHATYRPNASLILPYLTASNGAEPPATKPNLDHWYPHRTGNKTTYKIYTFNRETVKFRNQKGTKILAWGIKSQVNEEGIKGVIKLGAKMSAAR